MVYLGLSKRDVSVSHHLALPLKKQVCRFLELSDTNLLFLVRVKLEWLLSGQAGEMTRFLSELHP